MPKAKTPEDLPAWPETGPAVVTGSAGEPIYRKPTLVTHGPVQAGAITDDRDDHHLMFGFSPDPQDSGSTVFYRVQLDQDTLFALLWAHGSLERLTPGEVSEL